MVSPHPVSPLIDTIVIPIQSSLDHPPVIEGGVPPIPIITHPFQPRIEEVFIPVQSLVNPTLLVEGDASFNHVVSIPDPTPSEQERVLLSLSYLPLSIEEIPFD
jgi:hypothetical protein